MCVLCRHRKTPVDSLQSLAYSCCVHRFWPLGLPLSGPSWEMLHEEAKISYSRALVYNQKTIQRSPCPLPREKQSVCPYSRTTFGHCSCGQAIPSPESKRGIPRDAFSLSFGLFAFESESQVSPGWPQIQQVADDDLEPLIPLRSLPMCLDYRPVLTMGSGLTVLSPIKESCFPTGLCATWRGLCLNQLTSQSPARWHPSASSYPSTRLLFIRSKF